jgi:hypothetical protein
MTLSWLSVDAKTGGVLADLPDLDCPKVSRSICRYDSTTATLPIPTAPDGWEIATRPGGAVMILLSDDLPIWGGMVTQRTRGSGDTVALALATMEAYFDRRFVGDETYAAVGQNAIGADIAAKYLATGARGGIPIRVVQLGGAGTLRDRTYEDALDKSVYSIYTELAGIGALGNVAAGPEFSVSWEWQHSPERLTPVLTFGARLGAPVQAGMAVTATFDLPGCVTEASFIEDYSGSGRSANVVSASTTGDGTTRLVSPEQVAADDGRPTFQWRFTPTTSIQEVDTLTAHAARVLAAVKDGSTAIALSAVVSDAPKLGVEWDLGDDVGYSLTCPAFPDGLSGIARAYGWELTLGNTPTVTPILVSD